MQKITEEELSKEMIARVQTFRDLLARTPVDELEVHERPRAIFRVSENTWLEAIVRYLVPPRSRPRQNSFDQETSRGPQPRSR
jgi:hypothetical protein